MQSDLATWHMEIDVDVVVVADVADADDDRIVAAVIHFEVKSRSCSMAQVSARRTTVRHSGDAVMLL